MAGVDDTDWGVHLGTLLGLTDVADRLHIAVADVERLIDERRLLALPSTAGLAVPAFQLRGDEVVPGLREILAQLLPAAETPLTVAAFLTGPQPELDGETPAEWLARGGDVERAVLAARRTAALLAQ